MRILSDSQLDICSELKPLMLEDKRQILEFVNKRSIFSCEYSLTTLFLWKKMYNPHIYYHENFIIIFEYYEGACYALMPLCDKEYMLESFKKTVEIFHHMNETFEMYCVDQEFLDTIFTDLKGIYHVVDDRNMSDYIYDAEKLRTLKGKKLRKKRNHINAFLREYENRYYTQILSIEQEDEVCDFLTTWCTKHGKLSQHLIEEIEGIKYLLRNKNELESVFFGVYVDDILEAICIGSLINNEIEGIIHVEKANSDIRGLYPFINRQFLIEVYRDIELVNREDDLGLEGLRKSKMSYEPIRLESKYVITKK